MSIKAVENIFAGTGFYSMRDKASHNVQKRTLEAFDRIDAIRQSVDTKEKVDLYVENSKKAFKETMGILPYDSNMSLDAKITKVIEEPGLTIKNIIFQARENVYITGNLYIPSLREKKCPAVLLQCGHTRNGKGSSTYQSAARAIASRGIIVLVTDPVGQGEREQYIDDNGVSILNPAVLNHQQFGTQCFLNGENPIKYFLADAIKSVDLLCSLEEVDTNRIGATGESGGGTMTSLIMAYDERIKAGAPVCWPCSGREYFLSGSAPDSEQIWQNVLNNNIDVFEIIMCMCPKPVMLLGAAYDFIPIEGVKKLFDETKRLYSLKGCPQNIKLAVANEPHNYSKPLVEKASDFFAECFNTGIKQSEISTVAIEEKMLYATKSGTVLKDFPESYTIYDENLKEYHNHQILSEEEKIKAIEKIVFNNRDKNFEYNLRVIEPASNSFYSDGLWVEAYMWFAQEFMPCYGLMFKSAKNKEKNLPVTICLWQDGTDSLSTNAEKIWEICESDKAAFVVDLTAMGKNLPHKMKGNVDEKENLVSISDRITKCLFKIGDSLGAIQAYDLYQTISMVKDNFSTDIEVYTRGNYSVIARIIQKLSGNIKCTCDYEITIKKLIESKYYNSYDISHIIIPGIAKYID